MEAPHTWVQYLPWAQFAYNTSIHSRSQLTPFEVVYGRPVPILTTYIKGDTQVHAVEQAKSTSDFGSIES